MIKSMTSSIKIILHKSKILLSYMNVKTVFWLTKSPGELV